MFSIRNLFSVIVLASMCIMIAVGIFGERLYSEIAESRENVLKESYEQINAVNRLQFNFKQQVQEWKNILLRGKDHEYYHEYLSRFYESERNTRKEIELVLLKLDVDNKGARLLADKFNSAHRQAGKRYRQAINIYNETAENPHEAADKYVHGIDRAPAEMLNQLLSAISEHKDYHLMHLDREIKRKEMYIVIFLVIASIAMLSLLVWIIDRKISGPIAVAISASDRIASGDFKETEQPASNINEVQNLFKSLDLMRKNLLDMTSTLVAAEELEQAHSLNEHIISASPIGIAIYGHSGQCIVANNSIAKMIGVTQEQALAQNYNNLESWKGSGLFDAAHKSIRTQKRGRYEFDILSAFGKHAFFDCILVPFNLRGEQHLLLMLDDISKRKMVQEEYRILVESSHEVIFSKDREGKYHTANLKAAIGLGGACVEDVIGKTDYDLLPKEKADVLREADKQVMENQQTLEVEETVPVSEENERTYLSRKWPTFDKDGKVSGIACFAMDITKIKAAEAALNKYHHQLEYLVDERTKELRDTQDELVRKERLATLGQLTATVSHELRNPLGAMKPSLYVIEKKSDKNDEYIRNAIERIDRNINRCDKIIDELLDFTRITGLDRQATRIDEWLESVIDEQEIPKGIRIEKDLTLKDIELVIDSGRLRRAVINVVENAIHAMQDDSQHVRDDKNSCLCIKTGSNNGRIEIVISDTGIGIPGDMLEKIFEPLFSTKGFGVGLGMPTVKQIMEQHGGGIEVDSEEGKGATMTLWLSGDVSKGATA